MAELGDISEFLKESAVSNLDWLDVDEKTYREKDTLPKQNLDIVPDLEGIWAHEDKPATAYLVPNVAPIPGATNPKTMGDLSEAHGALRAKPEDIRKTARLALMQSIEPGHFRQALSSRYDSVSLYAARAVLASVLAERGLLGKLYIEASDFPTCHTGSAKAQEFVRRFAKDALFVVAKNHCGNCIHAQSMPTGKTNCAVFHKQIELQVPYTEALAANVEHIQQAKGKLLTVTAQEPKERIRLAMLANDFVAPGPSPMPKPKENVQRLLREGGAEPDIQKPIDLTPLRELAKRSISAAFTGGRINLAQAQSAYRIVAQATNPQTLQTIQQKADGVDTSEQRVYAGAGEQTAPAFVPAAVGEAQLISAAALTKKRDDATRMMLAAKKAAPVVALVRREMLKGKFAVDVVQSLRFAFQSDDLEATKEHWEPLLRQAGLYGTLYSTQDSFEDCSDGSYFLAKHNPGVKVMVAGAKCQGCVHNKIGRCLMYGKPLVASTEEVLTPQVAEVVLANHKAAGRIPSWDQRSAAQFGATPREALYHMHILANSAGTVVQAPTRMQVVKAFYGQTPDHTTAANTRQNIVKTASRFLNEGLYGEQLKLALKSRFEVRDLVAAADDLRPVLAEQGLQGIYFVDPTVYEDYGKGCKEAARLHRSKGVEYLKVGSKCGSCVHQTTAGFCSVVNKPLVAEPPYANKMAMQREVLASGPSTEMNFQALMNNGGSMMAEYELQNGPMQVEVEPEKQAAAPYDVQFGAAGQGLKL